MSSNKGQVKGTAKQAAPDATPDSFEQSSKLAFELHNAGRTAEAEALCRVLLQIRPQDGQVLFLLGMVLHKAGRDNEALGWLSLASQYHPEAARIFHGLGCVYQGLEDHKHAVAALEKAIQLDPQSPAPYYHLGLNCYWLEQVERAVSLFRRAVQINPQDSKSWNNLGKCLKELNQLDESIEAYNRALEIEPGYALVRYGRAVSLLTAGRLTEGFKEYESRWHSMPRRQFSEPQWKGENAVGKTLFVHAEQGFGDAIQMVRFIRLARERVGHVILECRPELHALFKHSKCADIVIPYGAPIPAFDYYLPSSSLPYALGIVMETIPNQIPYLQAPPHATLTSQQGQLKVGLAWAGNPSHHQDAARSLCLQDLTPILNVPNIAFYSLQQSVPTRDQACLASLSGALNANLKFKDYLETASVVNAMDLIISVDTSVAHLAGALGKPVWTLIQHSPDWRWFLDRTDSPWYLTMKLYRQAERNRWESPVTQIAEDLRRLATGHTLSLPGLQSNHAANFAVTA
jgi:tetratricopeptide (TPR) repeat protein